MFEVGKVYSRRDDIHAQFGGQERGGIATPSQHPFVFIFTGDTGEQYGYSDGWDPEGVFLYTGEGQEGDMQFVRGNRAIRDHAKEGKDLLLFEALGKGKGVRYLGTFVCANYEYQLAPDKNEVMRQAIVFHLVPAQPDDFTTGDASDPDEENAAQPPLTSLDELRKAAYLAAESTEGKAGQAAKRNIYRRSHTIRTYVLARAKGKCEACMDEAPFQRADGSPYLEPHHLRRVSDGGPDHPRWVAALCPNCHREAHFGLSATEKNHALKQLLGILEKESP